jgi:hypothetical protein
MPLLIAVGILGLQIEEDIKSIHDLKVKDGTFSAKPVNDGRANGVSNIRHAPRA